MTMGWPVVDFLKNAKSAGKCHGSVPSRPMTRSGVIATMAVRWSGAGMLLNGD
jgi:hypothetical protein